MANMRSKNKTGKHPSEAEMDRIVTAQANNDAAWEKPVRVRRNKTASLSLPPALVARAAFLARLHRTPTVEEWLAHVIQERIELEEAAFVGVKHELSEKT